MLRWNLLLIGWVGYLLPHSAYLLLGVMRAPRVIDDSRRVSFLFCQRELPHLALAKLFWSPRPLCDPLGSQLPGRIDIPNFIALEVPFRFDQQRRIEHRRSVRLSLQALQFAERQSAHYRVQYAFNIF